MSPRVKRYAPNAKEWISEHEPDWEERRALARAIVGSHPEGSVIDAPFNIHRTGEQFTIEGPKSTVVLRTPEELDQIMAAIAWVDAIEERLKGSV
jgi:hypothetical protein